MTSKRGNFELDEERDRELMSIFKQVMASKECLSLEDVLKRVVSSPSSRFWVSRDRAWRIIQIMLKGRNPHISFASKRAMYNEIYHRVIEFRTTHKKIPMSKIVSEVIRQPAPEFYMTTKCAELLLYNARQREKKKQKKLFGIFNLHRKDPDFEKLEEHVERGGEHIGCES